MASDTRILYTFVASGQQAVADAFLSVERAAKKSSKAVETSTREGERAQRGAATRVEREAERQAAAQRRTAERMAEGQIRAAERSAAARVRADERAYQQMARAAERAYAQEERAHERHQEQLRRQAERSAAAQARAEQKVAESRRSSWKGVGRDAAFSAAASATAGAVALGGLVAREAMKLEDATTRLSVNSRGAGQAFADPRQLQEEFRAVAVKTGTTATDIAGGMSSFVSKTGRLDLGRKFAETIGHTATATGASVEDVSATAADLVTKFKIETVDELQAAMSGLAYQGKLGAFELKDAASQFARMGAAAASFGIGTGPQAVRVLGGLAQIARDATGSPEQAATAVEHVFSAFVSKGRQIKQEGVDVFRNNKARDPRDILVDLISKAGGTDKAQKLAKMKEIFGDFGIRAVNPLVAAYGSAYDAAQGTDKQRMEAATKALRARIDDAVSAAGDWNEVLRDSAKSQDTASAKLSKTWEAMMAELAPIATDAMPLFVDAIKQGAAALLWLAKALGYKIPEKSHAEKAKELEAKAQDVGVRLAKAKASGASPEKLAALEAEQKAYQTSAAVESAQVMGPASAVFGKTMTPEEFTQQMEALGEQSGQWGVTSSDVAARAEMLARGKVSAETGLFSMIEAPLAWGTQLATGRPLSSYGDIVRGIELQNFEGAATPEQRKLFEQYSAQVRQQTGGDELHGVKNPGETPGSPKYNANEVQAYNDKLRELMTAAEKAAKALNEIKPPEKAKGGSTFVGID